MHHVVSENRNGLQAAQRHSLNQPRHLHVRTQKAQIKLILA